MPMGSMGANVTEMPASPKKNSVYLKIISKPKLQLSDMTSKTFAIGLP
jgi:hypothetical protein